MSNALCEGVEGMSSIRVFGQVDRFVERFHDATDASSTALLNFVSAQRWLGLRIELLGSIVVLVSSALVVSLNRTLNLDPGLGVYNLSFQSHCRSPILISLVPTKLDC